MEVLVELAVKEVMVVGEWREKKKCTHIKT
jgi:hypothetical protein